MKTFERLHTKYLFEFPVVCPCYEIACKQLNVKTRKSFCNCLSQSLLSNSLFEIVYLWNYIFAKVDFKHQLKIRIIDKYSSLPNTLLISI